MMGLINKMDMTVIMGIIVKGSGHTYMMNHADMIGLSCMA